jgi:hypothetical protein
LEGSSILFNFVPASWRNCFSPYRFVALSTSATQIFVRILRVDRSVLCGTGTGVCRYWYCSIARDWRVHVELLRTSVVSQKGCVKPADPLYKSMDFECHLIPTNESFPLTLSDLTNNNNNNLHNHKNKYNMTVMAPKPVTSTSAPKAAPSALLSDQAQDIPIFLRSE